MSQLIFCTKLELFQISIKESKSRHMAPRGPSPAGLTPCLAQLMLHVRLHLLLWLLICWPHRWRAQPASASAQRTVFYSTGFVDSSFFLRHPPTTVCSPPALCSLSPKVPVIVWVNTLVTKVKGLEWSVAKHNCPIKPCYFW